LKSEEIALYLLAEDDTVRIAGFIWLKEIPDNFGGFGIPIAALIMKT